MIGNGIVGVLATCIVIAAGLYLLYVLLNPAPIPYNLKMAVYILVFILVFIWVVKKVLPMAGLTLAPGMEQVLLTWAGVTLRTVPLA